jgi:hypothetical protein
MLEKVPVRHGCLSTLEISKKLIGIMILSSNYPDFGTFGDVPKPSILFKIDISVRDFT